MRTARSHVLHGWKTHRSKVVLIGGSGQQRYALFLRIYEIRVQAQSGQFQVTLYADRLVNRETRYVIRNTDWATIVLFSRLGHRPLTLPTQLLLKKEYAAYGLTGKLLTSREKACFRISQTRVVQLCYSCPFNVELSGEEYQV